MEWLDTLGASLDASRAREEDEAAADLAFSLRQDAGLAEALVRSGSGWLAFLEGEASLAVDEVGTDYVRAGSVLLRLGALRVRSASTPPPRSTGRTFLEILGAACREGVEVEVIVRAGTARGVLVRVGSDHLSLRRGDVVVLVGLSGIERVRIAGGSGYSASRGLSG